MFALMKSQISLKMSHFGIKPRSPGHMLKKPCVSSRGHIYVTYVTWSECFPLLNLGRV